MGQISIYDPRTMGKVVSRMPKTKTFLKDTFFKGVQTFHTVKIDVDFVKGSRKLAPFVHKKKGGVTVPNTGYATDTYEPPVLMPNKITTIDDILTRLPGETIYGGKSPEERAIEKMVKDMAELEEMIARREEWMCAQALFTGEIPILGWNGKPVQEAIDFGFTNKVVLPEKEKWNKVTGGKIKALKAWRKQVQKNGFVNCNVAIMGETALESFLADEEVMKMLDVQRYDIAVIKPKELPNGTTYIGTIQEIGLDIYTYDEWYLDDWTDPENPENKPIVPPNVVALLSTSAFYSMYYGAIGMTDRKKDNIYVAEGTRIPDQWVEGNPARRFLQLNSAPLPVPHEVDSWLVATVC